MAVSFESESEEASSYGSDSAIEYKVDPNDADGLETDDLSDSDQVRRRTSTDPPVGTFTINNEDATVISPHSTTNACNKSNNKSDDESKNETYEDDLWSDDKDEPLVDYDSILDSDSENAEPPWEPPQPLDSDTDDDDNDSSSENISSNIGDSSCDNKSNPDQVEMVVKLVQIGCKKRKLHRRIRRAAKKCIAKLIKGNSYRCVKNKYMCKQMKPQDAYSSVHQIYCLMKDKDSNDVEKMGYSRNTRDRYIEYPTSLESTFILVSQRTIPRPLDRALIDIVDKLLDDIRNDQSLPVDFCRICYTINRQGGDALGLERSFYLQLIEIGSQYQYGLPVLGEVFTTGETEQKHRRLQVQKAFQKWIGNENDDLASFIGKPIKMVDRESFSASSAFSWTDPSLLPHPVGRGTGLHYRCLFSKKQWKNFLALKNVHAVHIVLSFQSLRQELSD